MRFNDGEESDTAQWSLEEPDGMRQVQSPVKKSTPRLRSCSGRPMAMHSYGYVEPAGLKTWVWAEMASWEEGVWRALVRLIRAVKALDSSRAEPLGCLGSPGDLGPLRLWSLVDASVPTPGT